MFEVLLKAFTFILIIIIGYCLKHFKVLNKSDSNILATIVMNITLPCALLTGANGITMSCTIIILVLVGVISNVLTICMGFLASKKRDNKTKGVYMLNTSGYNIGNFVLPFVQSFYPGVGVGYLCAYDIGNALMGLGITYAMADHVASDDSQTFKITDMLKKLFSSIPFDVYMIVFILAIFKLSIPTPILTIASTIGAGNSFLAMLMIGILLEIKIPLDEIKSVFRLLVVRLSTNAVMIAIIFIFFPLPILAKEILALALCAPLSVVSAVFSKRIGYHGDLPAAANSLSIIISVVVTTILLLIFV